MNSEPCAWQASTLPTKPHTWPGLLVHFSYVYNYACVEVSVFLSMRRVLRIKLRSSDLSVFPETCRLLVCWFLCQGLTVLHKRPANAWVHTVLPLRPPRQLGQESSTTLSSRLEHACLHWVSAHSLFQKCPPWGPSSSTLWTQHCGLINSSRKPSLPPPRRNWSL